MFLSQPATRMLLEQGSAAAGCPATSCHGGAGGCISGSSKLCGICRTLKPGTRAGTPWRQQLLMLGLSSKLLVDAEKALVLQPKDKDKEPAGGGNACASCY